MNMQPIQTDKAPSAIGPYSQGMIAENLLFTSGQIPLDPETGELVTGNIELQTERVIENIKAVVEAGGGSLKTIIKTTVYLTNMSDFSAVNSVYGKYFGEKKPARSCVEVSALPKGVAIEIEAIAFISNG